MNEQELLRLISSLREDLKLIKEEMVTKNDLKSFATKEDLKSFATKEDLKAFATKEDLKAFATKEDLKAFATKEDLKAFATKEDLKAFATKEDLKAFATKEDLKAFATKEDLKAFATKEDLKVFATKEDFLEFERRFSSSLEKLREGVRLSLLEVERELTDIKNKLRFYDFDYLAKQNDVMIKLLKDLYEEKTMMSAKLKEHDTRIEMLESVLETK